MKDYNINPSDYKILILDDENVIRKITEELLMDLGYQIIGFEKPLDAIEYYTNNNHNIDLVVLDMMMPELNGAEVFYQLQKINPFLLAVILSGYEGVEEKYKFLLDDGLCKFFKKPINVNIFDKSIKDILQNRFSFDPEKGLSTLLYNENIYMKLLKTYLEENKDLEKKVLGYLENNDYYSIELLIHKIKGISLNLGAKKTYRITNELNRKFKDSDVNSSDIISFVKHHNLIIKDIQRYLGDVNVS